MPAFCAHYNKRGDNMKKALILLCSIAVIAAAFTGCASDKKDATTTNDQTLTPTSSMSEKVSEKMTEMSEDVSEALTDASEDMKNDDTTKKEDTTKPSENKDN